jgi:two-component system OmpR family sensor kinase
MTEVEQRRTMLGSVGASLREGIARATRRLASLSLASRLVVATACIAGAAIAATGLATYRLLEGFLDTQADQALSAASAPLEQALDTGVPLTLRTVARFAPGMYVEIRDASGVPLATVNTAVVGSALLEPALPSGVLPLVGDRATYLTVPSATSGGPAFRVLVAPLAGGAELVVGLPLASVGSTLGHLATVETLAGLLALVGALLAAWWLLRVGLRPLSAVERAAERIAEGRLNTRAPSGSGAPEVERLANAFNAMLDRIEQAFAERDRTEAALRASEARLRQFVADASHELRTPVAAVGAYAELFERGAKSRPEDLERVLAGIRSEAARMWRLVEDLLLLARLDDGLALHLEPVELVRLAAEAVEASLAVGPAWPVTLVAAAPVEVRGDSARLRQVLDNLLTNVRTHTPPGTPARVEIRASDGMAELVVADEGPGIPAQAAERVFERFYRGDPSRSRTSGGAGLGLAIVRAIAQAHGGSVELVSGPGTTVLVRLPQAGPSGGVAEARVAASSQPSAAEH